MDKMLSKIKMSNGHMTILQFIFAYGILHTVSIDSILGIVATVSGLVIITISKNRKG